MALPDKTWRFGKKRSKHREVHVRRDMIAARLFTTRNKKAVPHRARDGLNCKTLAYRKLPQKRWMRLQASSRSEVLVA
jgi:hypothetical protein